MAKKNKAQDDLMEEKKSHAIFYTIAILIVILFWLALFSIFVRLDIYNLGTTLRPALEDIPVVNMILPKQTEAEIAEANDYPYTNLKDAIARIKELEAQLAQAKEENNKAAGSLDDLNAEIERLKVFEENQLEFEERVKKFDENVVFADEAPGLDAYKEYYDEINPDNAALIYEKVVKQLQFDKAVQDKADIYKKMKPAQAAAILQEMTADSEFVAKVLLSMEPKYSSAILAAMDPTYAAKITKKMLDLDAERLSVLE